MAKGMEGRHAVQIEEVVLAQEFQVEALLNVLGLRGGSTHLLLSVMKKQAWVGSLPVLGLSRTFFRSILERVEATYEADWSVREAQRCGR